MSATTKNVWVLAARPGADAKIKPELFRKEEQELPELKDGEILARTLWVSVDPYLRSRFNNVASYVSPYEIGKPITSTGVVVVEQSRAEGVSVGQTLSGAVEWSDRFIANASSFTPVDKDAAPLSAYCGILGLTGLSAYFPIDDIAQPKKGEVAFVSGAAGAVGSVVCQILLNVHGCRVVGSAGSEDKVEWLRSLGVEAFNYKTEDTGAALDRLAADGVDIYWDNVGGATLEAVLDRMRSKGRVVSCGAISQYQLPKEEMYGVRNLFQVVVKCLKMQGFLLGQYRARFAEGVTQLATWLREGKLQNRETVVEGLDHIPDALMGIFAGANTGKMVVHVGDV